MICLKKLNLIPRKNNIQQIFEFTYDTFNAKRLSFDQCLVYDKKNTYCIIINPLTRLNIRLKITEISKTF